MRKQLEEVMYHSAACGNRLEQGVLDQRGARRRYPGFQSVGRSRYPGARPRSPNRKGGRGSIEAVENESAKRIATVVIDSGLKYLNGDLYRYETDHN